MYKIAIDLGTSTTKICKAGKGVVLCEPSCLAVNAERTKIVAYGEDAKNLTGEKAVGTTLTFPIFEGDIIDVDLCAEMLKFFLNKAGIKSSLLGLDVVFCVNVGISDATRERYYRLADLCLFKNIAFIENPFLSAYGQGLDISPSTVKYIVDIGSGCTNLAVLNIDNMVAGFSINIGGANIDSHLVDFVASEYNLKINILKAEKTKFSAASLSDENVTTRIRGKDIDLDSAREIQISSKDFLVAVQVYMDKIIEYIEMILSKLPEDMAKDVWKNGIYLSGGTANIKGISDYFAEKLGMKVSVAENPQYATIRGASVVLQNKDTIEKIRLKD